MLHGGFESKLGILWDYLDKRTFWICKVGVYRGSHGLKGVVLRATSTGM